MDDQLRKIAIEHKLDNLYKNNFFSIKSICEYLGIWENYSSEEKVKLENLTPRDSRLNKHFQYKGDYDINLSYGEITRKGVDKIIEKILKYKKDIKPSDVLVDIGSGSGKLLIHSAMRMPISTYVGVEIVTERWKYSKHILEKLLPIDDKKIFLINKDVRQFDLSIAKIAFCNNVLFSKELNDWIYESIPTGCHIITARPIENFKILKENFEIGVSWSDMPFEFFYYIK